MQFCLIDFNMLFVTVLVQIMFEYTNACCLPEQIPETAELPIIRHCLVAASVFEMNILGAENMK